MKGSRSGNDMTDHLLSTEVILVKDNASDSFLLHLTFSQASGTMKLMKKLVESDGEDDFHYVFSGEGVIHKRGTFNRQVRVFADY
jgi:hypothetical protein